MTIDLPDYQRIAPDVKLGRDVRIFGFVNLYGCEIGDETKIGTFVEIQKGVRIGNRCKISSHTFICEGVTIESGVFVGRRVTFINDRFDGELRTDAGWNYQTTVVKQGASIGSGTTLLGGITIGENAMVGAGSVITEDVPRDTTVAGNPARILSRVARNA